MKRICEFCKWFTPFYRSVGEGLYEPVDIGECKNSKFGEIDVVKTDYECCIWEKRDGKSTNRAVGWTGDVPSSEGID